jgi:uncharacterized protein YbjQ (UPF0145 family)
MGNAGSDQFGQPFIRKREIVIAQIPVVTSSVLGNWRVVDTVMGVGSAKSSWSGGPDASAALDECKEIMRSLALALDADAVINCDFELRDFDGGLNIVGFGTAISFIEEI